MQSKWTHLACEDCWDKNNPGRQAARLKPEFCAVLSPCCWCGKPTNSGIFVRRDPGLLLCKGNHSGEKEGSNA